MLIFALNLKFNYELKRTVFSVRVERKQEEEQMSHPDHSSDEEILILVSGEMIVGDNIDHENWRTKSVILGAMTTA